MSTNASEWEPGYGFCGYNLTPNEQLAEALEAIRRQVCAYGRDTEGRRGGTCDCKYGINVTTRYGSEQNGCCELTELINRLLHRPETLAGDDDAATNLAKAKNKGYDLALDQVSAYIDQMKDPRNFARTL